MKGSEPMKDIGTAMKDMSASDRTTAYQESAMVKSTLEEQAIKVLAEFRMTHRGEAGAIIVLGFNEQMHASYVAPLKHDHGGTGLNLHLPGMYMLLTDFLLEDDDGAMLTSNDGTILHTGYQLEVSPRHYLESIGAPNHQSLGERMGFMTHVGTRHIYAKTASYEMKGTSIIVLSQESSHIRGFREGRTFYSPFPGEIGH